MEELFNIEKNKACYNFPDYYVDILKPLIYTYNCLRVSFSEAATIVSEKEENNIIRQTENK